jgi:hypothetical protein
MAYTTRAASRSCRTPRRWRAVRVWAASAREIGSDRVESAAELAQHLEVAGGLAEIRGDVSETLVQRAELAGGCLDGGPRRGVGRSRRRRREIAAGGGHLPTGPGGPGSSSGLSGDLKSE